MENKSTNPSVLQSKVATSRIYFEPGFISENFEHEIGSLQNLNTTK